MELTATLTVMTLLCVTGDPGKRELVDRIVAVVNDDVIALSELKTAVASLPISAEKQAAAEKATLSNLIDDRLITQQIREAKISVGPADIDRAIDDITRQNNITRAQLVAAIEARGMDFKRYRSDLEQQIMRLKLVDLKVRQRVSVSAVDIRAEYERLTAKEKAVDLITLRHLLFRWGESPDPKERARVFERSKAARARIVDGADFAAVAKEVSDGPTATSGGSLGEIARTELLPELGRAARTLKQGEISAPIETANGVHVIRIEGIRKKSPPPFEAMKSRIYQELYKVEVERQTAKWVQELRDQAAIEIRL